MSSNTQADWILSSSDDYRRKRMENRVAVFEERLLKKQQFEDRLMDAAPAPAPFDEVPLSEPMMIKPETKGERIKGIRI